MKGADQLSDSTLFFYGLSGGSVVIPAEAGIPSLTTVFSGDFFKGLGETTRGPGLRRDDNASRGND
ncbi:MAG: hypothetical protein NTV01_14310 [Bacteroidia bacterium]|nr:hypothetical protein [Bacteroidia bacterium]